MIDHAQLDTLTQLLGKDTINQIRLEYVQDSRQKMTTLLDAWEERNYQELQNVSHSLKSSSLNMAMLVFAKQCQLIEKFASQHNEQEIQAIIDDLLALHKISLKALAAYFS
ncbi:Hpt domain-containing protein [Marinomonas primoryensis]|jgi:HPt (histidine-containing phosphotransfer) domain-containing protein|uniref:Histidine-containing phosphotransfer domain-containing protein n=1 Tax=Marinomonas primoryensis TaxID=178399 RepID=A0A859D0Z7_9GAMM|nr:Hpt domain-containing protein [Marinomonas primoryensis]QKK82484.1 histidine-containing phosphotransfer domain-containing protein [Marinomonas primoryensis]|tara:strand:+ start:1570 stop:1902 length:333 start_codon:yes stop_codon:yes gene_type:complete